MIESLVIIVALLWVASRLSDSVQKQRMKQSGAQPRATAAPVATEVVRVLRIEGTNSFEGDRGFVKSFGINPKDVRALHLFTGPCSFGALPERVRGCLRKCFEDGTTRGPEVAGLASGRDTLPQGQGLFFALLEKPRSAPYIVAFVDKVKAVA